MNQENQTHGQNQERTQSLLFGLLTRPILLFCMVLMLMTGAFLSGLGMGFGVGRWSQGPEFLSRSAVAAVPECVDADAGDNHGYAELAPHMPVFREAVNLLYRDFYGDLPEPEQAIYAAIRGIVGTLDDPNTSFMEPVDADFFRTNLEGSFEGIGARVSWDEAEDTLLVTEPFENQPAWAAGIRRDDLILAVDGESLVGGSISEAVRKIRGPKGSTVILTIKRAVSVEAPASTAAPDLSEIEVDFEIFDVAVVRDQIEIPTISTDTLGEDGEIAYIRLNSFNENAGQLVRQAVREAVRADAHALVFDLRGNTGGLLREAVRVASVFLQNETVLLERFSDGRMETYTTSGRAVINDIPMVVLINGGTASASEIVAGALQDAGRATLIGDITYGKGSVQLPHTLSDGSIMRVTIARWYTPLDRTIDGIGLQPDILVERPLAAEGPVEPSREAPIEPQTDALENGLNGALPSTGSGDETSQSEDSSPSREIEPRAENGVEDPELETALEFLYELFNENDGTQ